MLEARLSEALVLKKILDAVKELVSDANIDCSDTGISLQSMDQAHVALVTFLLRAEGFENYRCDRSLSLGINVVSLSKIIKCAGNDDAVTVKASEDSDLLNLLFEDPKTDRVSEFDLKLMDIDQEHLGIPEPEYDAVIEMPANEFQRICKDMGIMGETLTITVTKEGVKFSAEGELGNGSVSLKPGASIDDKDGGGVRIEMNNACSLSFSLKYMNNFTKATTLSDTVVLSMASDAPLSLDYKVGEFGYVRYYLAPKVGDDEEN